MAGGFFRFFLKGLNIQKPEIFFINFKNINLHPDFKIF
jgi:hypothetical protein